MALLDMMSKGFWAIADIGVTPAIRPEETKHIRYLNIGVFLSCIINLAYFFQSIATEIIPIIVAIAQISSFFLGLFVFILHILGRYNAARIYCFLIFYAVALFTYPLSGKEVVDHYFIFIAIAYAFLVFPRKEKGSMTIIIIIGVISYLAVLVLYDHVEPVLLADQYTVNLGNQVMLYIIFIVFIIFMMSGKYFTDKTEDDLMEERKKLATWPPFSKRCSGGIFQPRS